MLIIKRQGYYKRYAYGGSGLLSSVGEVVKKLITSKAAKKLAADTSKMLLEARAKKVGEVVVNKTQKIINKIENKSSTSLTPESIEALQTLTNPQVSINGIGAVYCHRKISSPTKHWDVFEGYITPKILRFVILYIICV